MFGETSISYASFYARYMPETKEAKKQRLMQMAESQEKGKQVETKKPLVLKYGLNHVTSLIESKQAKLVVIPHDVSSAFSALSKQLYVHISYYI